MDLLTQGVVGAALAQASRTDRKHMVAVGLSGFLAGMAPDLDALIRSPTDPLIFLEFHRHFTHALAFIPIGGLLCAALLFRLAGRRWPLTFWQTALCCTLGYATHGLLDAMTSYGTSLAWPFSDVRVSWSLISIIDPLFSIPILVLVVLAAMRSKPLFARIGLGWGLVYLSAAAIQHQTALDMASDLATDRGHTPVRIETKPSFGNILVWRTIYETGDGFYIDAVRAGVSPQVFEGARVDKLVPSRDLPWLDPASQQARDIERFRFFSLGNIAQDPEHPNRIVDIRYSFVPNEVKALWSIELSPEAGADDHARYLTHRENARTSLGDLWMMITE